jgi:hypothetical protein
MCFIHVIIYVLYIQDAGPEIRPAELEADGFASYVMVLISTLVGAVDMRAFEIRDSLLTIHVESA